MSENNNKKDSGKLKNNELFVISPDDDETVERFSGNIDSFEFFVLGKVGFVSLYSTPSLNGAM
jgi:hypothetical protein